MSEPGASELREDTLTGNLVIVAPTRSARPHTFHEAAPPPASRHDCPFCAGNEHETPPEVLRTGAGAPDTPGWRVRVVPNKYPIVGAGVPGAHEVVVLSPAHDRSFAQLAPEHAREVLLVLRDRAASQLRAGHRHVQAFLNHGRAAGASIEHPHAQLVALDFVPPQVDRALDRFHAAGGDLVVDAIAQARCGPYVVHDDVVVAWCPPASPSPYALRCAIPDAGARFDRATDDEITAVTDALLLVLGRLHVLLGDFAYNVVFNSAPRDDARPSHWWVDVLPRLGVVAGFEQGTGILVCSVAPEDAARDLRDIS